MRKGQGARGKGQEGASRMKKAAFESGLLMIGCPVFSCALALQPECIARGKAGLEVGSGLDDIGSRRWCEMEAVFGRAGTERAKLHDRALTEAVDDFEAA